ncbi:MAG: hypothetical protein P1T08_00645 [Acidimicrobiia bacterium]|nr:hypothetical protein [Acidimicrobiia bacterium]
MDPYNNLRAYGEALIDSVDSARAEVVAVRALAAPSAGLPLRRRLLAIAAAAATFISGNVGMAMAADSAVPGDLLYGLDRAYEQLSELVGLGGDHRDERLEEAAQLASAGNPADALDAVIEQIEALKTEPAVDVSELDTAVVAVTEARDRALEVSGNQTAQDKTDQAKKIVSLAHQIADAVQDPSLDRGQIKKLIDLLKSAAQDNGNGNGNAYGRDKDNGQGRPEDPGNRGIAGTRVRPPNPDLKRGGSTVRLMTLNALSIRCRNARSSPPDLAPCSGCSR